MYVNLHDKYNGAQQKIMLLRRALKKKAVSCSCDSENRTYIEVLAVWMENKEQRDRNEDRGWVLALHWKCCCEYPHFILECLV